MDPVAQSACDARHDAVNQYLSNDRRRLDAHSESIDRLQKLTAEMAMLNQQLTNITQDHETRLRIIEQVPAKRWDRVVSQIISLLLAAMLGGLISQLIG